MEAQELIIRMKQVRQQRHITYDDIMTELETNGVPEVSRSTLRRVFAKDSELTASNFNYEKTLIPIREAMRKLVGCPDEAHHEAEIAELEEKIKHLEDRITALTEQLDKKDAMIMRLIDRLDTKDAIISQLLIDLKKG